MSKLTFCAFLYFIFCTNKKSPFLANALFDLAEILHTCRASKNDGQYQIHTRLSKLRLIIYAKQF